MDAPLLVPESQEHRQSKGIARVTTQKRLREVTRGCAIPTHHACLPGGACTHAALNTHTHTTKRLHLVTFESCTFATHHACLHDAHTALYIVAHTRTHGHTHTHTQADLIRANSLSSPPPPCFLAALEPTSFAPFCTPALLPVLLTPLLRGPRLAPFWPDCMALGTWLLLLLLLLLPPPPPAAAPLPFPAPLRWLMSAPFLPAPRAASLCKKAVPPPLPPPPCLLLLLLLLPRAVLPAPLCGPLPALPLLLVLLPGLCAAAGGGAGPGAAAVDSG
mmetsp:Transcript_15936/g.43348  ORF Transcript_15936/g.43348 Transcript_15936/m.43348 type:complete len:275 (+) Transcript_15936:2086-2910(+)